MKNKVLIIFKYPHGWNMPVIKKFSNYYETDYVYLSNFNNKNFLEVINDINDLISSKNFNIIVFDLDYFKFINLFFIEKINGKKKIIWTGDDFELHEMNSITASVCDIVLSTCPLSVLKYKEKGYEAYFTTGENGKISEDNKHKKEIDVLFFGVLTKERNEILNYISHEGIDLKNVGHPEGSSGLSEKNLTELILKSRIILNLSKTRTTSVRSFSSENIYKFYYQTKGRMIIAGINGVVCVSEYSPGHELLFNNDEMPTFFTKEECVKILKDLLNNNKLLTDYQNKFTSKSRELFEDKKSFLPIYNAIEKPSNRKINLIKIPYWYLRISAKHILIKNIKLSNIVKSAFQLKTIFSMTKNSNFFVKSLIVIESFVNILWYSIISSLRFKKVK